MFISSGSGLIRVEFKNDIFLSQGDDIIKMNYDEIKKICHTLESRGNVNAVIDIGDLWVTLYEVSEGFNIEDENNILAIDKRSDLFDVLKVYEQSNGGRKAALIYQKPHSCGTASIISDIEDETDTYMCVLKAGGDRHPDFISIRQNNGEISLSKSEAEAMIKYLTTVTPSMKG